ncbi:MAG: VanZ family protein [Pygmaiobacter sp.]
MKKKQIVRLVLTCTTVLLTLWIFSNSLQVAEVSATRSDTVAHAINTALASHGLRQRVSDFFVRKSAHFSEYTLLGTLLLCTLRSYTPKLRRCYGGTAALGCLVAACDESLQLFVSGRSGQLRDVLLDTGGVLFGALLALLVLCLILFFMKRRIQT